MQCPGLLLAGAIAVGNISTIRALEHLDAVNEVVEDCAGLLPSSETEKDLVYLRLQAIIAALQAILGLQDIGKGLLGKNPRAPLYD